MKCKIEKSRISGQIVCPSNKSYSHRAIFLASLAGNNSKIENVLNLGDKHSPYLDVFTRAQSCVRQVELIND